MEVVETGAVTVIVMGFWLTVAFAMAFAGVFIWISIGELRRTNKKRPGRTRGA